MFEAIYRLVVPSRSRPLVEKKIQPCVFLIHQEAFQVCLTFIKIVRLPDQTRTNCSITQIEIFPTSISISAENIWVLFAVFRSLSLAVTRLSLIQFDTVSVIFNRTVSAWCKQDLHSKADWHFFDQTMELQYNKWKCLFWSSCCHVLFSDVASWPINDLQSA